MARSWTCVSLSFAWDAADASDGDASAAMPIATARYFFMRLLHAPAPSGRRSDSPSSAPMGAGLSRKGSRSRVGYAKSWRFSRSGATLQACRSRRVRRAFGGTIRLAAQMSLRVSRAGQGHPLLLITGIDANLDMWAPFERLVA